MPKRHRSSHRSNSQLLLQDRCEYEANLDPHTKARIQALSFFSTKMLRTWKSACKVGRLQKIYHTLDLAETGAGLKPLELLQRSSSCDIGWNRGRNCHCCHLFFLRGKEKQKKIHKKKHCAIDSSKQLQVRGNVQRNTKSLREFASDCSSARSWERRRRRRHLFYGQNREKSNYTTTDVVPKKRTSRASMRIKFPSGQRI